MHNIDAAGNALAHAYEPGGTLGSIGNVGGDMHFDSSENWRRDSDAVGGGAMSIKYVAVHELGHILGLGHSSNTGSIMYSAAASTWVFDNLYPNGLSDLDLRCIECVYGERYESCCLADACWESNSSYTSGGVVKICSSSSVSPSFSPSSSSYSSSFSSSISTSPSTPQSSSSSSASSGSSKCCQATDYWSWGGVFTKGIVVKHHIPVIIGGNP
jgi:hypothetical protein